jgi:hypothetical protein
MKNDMPEADIAFDILYSRSLEVNDAFTAQNQLALRELLKEGEAEIAQGRVFSSQEAKELLAGSLSGIKEEAEQKHLAWLETLQHKAKARFDTPLISYLWTHQKQPVDLLYFPSWRIVDRVLNLYKRLCDKGILFSCYVVSELLHQKTPYSPDGELPVFEWRNQHVSIVVMNTDPINTNWLVMVDIGTSQRYKTARPLFWLTDGLGDPMKARLIAGLPDDLRRRAEAYDGTSSFTGVVCDDYDLHGLLVNLLAD